MQAALTRLPPLDEWIDPTLKLREGWPTGLRPFIRRMARPAQRAWPSPIRRASGLPMTSFLPISSRSRLRAVRCGAARVLSPKELELCATKVLKSLPYAPTAAQVRAVAEIAADMAAPLRMNRLLQGDVGAGKTLVAFQALLIAVEAGGQGVMMAPTEILLASTSRASPLGPCGGVRLELLTGRDRGSDRAMKLEDLAMGRIPILVGTHAVFQKDVEFKDLRLAVVDEQHRFRAWPSGWNLAAKGEAVDVLVMTATPIPRSLALATAWRHGCL